MTKVVSRPIKRHGRWGKFVPDPMMFGGGALPSVRNIKYTRMCRFKKQNSQNYSQVGSRESFSPGFTVALVIHDCV